LAADAELDQDEGRRFHSPVEVVRDRQIAPIARGLQHPSGQSADHLSPLRVDVVEHQLPQVEPVGFAREPRHQLRGIGRAASDDRQFHGAGVLVRNTDEMTLTRQPGRVKY
jgi:hypothetical protein